MSEKHEPILRGLKALEEVFRWKLSAAARGHYCAALEDLPLEAMIASVRLTLRHFKGFFPLPADLREYATEYLAERRRQEQPEWEGGDELTEEGRREVLTSIRQLIHSLDEKMKLGGA